VEVGDEAPPEAQLNAIAAAKPDAILAAPLGAAIIPFLTQLANVKASTPGWEPKVYVTNTVASSLILGGAKEAANGIISSGYVKDVGDPAVQAADPNVQMYIDLMTARGKGDIATTAGRRLERSRGDRGDHRSGRGVRRWPDPCLDHGGCSEHLGRAQPRP
jgi:ABC-type branched-subunit amino acid transport system substrate-binding protein